MRTDVKLDKKQVICRYASTLGFSKNILSCGDLFIYRTDNSDTATCRMLARIKFAPAIGEDKAPIKNWICAMQLSTCATFTYERWVNPDWITEIPPIPTKLAQFFFAPALPYSADLLRKLMEYGTISNQYIDGIAERAKLLDS